MIKDYIIKERLGTGAFGIVYKVLKQSNNYFYVIKQIPLFGLTQKQINDAKLESKILSSVKSIYIVRYYESFEENNYLNIVMEYCDGGDLSQFIEKNKQNNKLLEENLIWNIFLKITIGLASLHKSKILHRDLKSLNIFLTKNLDIKIGDFGVAKILTQTGFAKTIIGTPYYLSPELCDELPYNDKSDVWALGCILYELSTFNHPFNAQCQASLVLKIIQNAPEPINDMYSDNLKKLINIILDKNHLTRPSCYEILNIPFVIEKAKELGLYEKIKCLYPDLNMTKKNCKFGNNNLYFKSFDNISEEKEKNCNKNNNDEKQVIHTEEVKNCNYNKVILNKFIKLDSVRNRNKSKDKSKEKNIKNKFKLNIKRLKEKIQRSKSCDINLDISKSKSKEKQNKKNNNMSHRLTESKSKSKKSKNKINKSIDDLNKKFKNKNKSKHNILKLIKSKTPPKFISNNLSLNDKLFKDQSKNDIKTNNIKSKNINKNKIRYNDKEEKKLINMKDFVKFLNNYVTYHNNSDCNSNKLKRKKDISKEKSNSKRNNYNNEKSKSKSKSKEKIISKKSLKAINSSIVNNQNENNYYEKLHTNIDNNEIIHHQFFNNASINIYNNINNIQINNINNISNFNINKNNSKEIPTTYVNKHITYNKKNSIIISKQNKYKYKENKKSNNLTDSEEKNNEKLITNIENSKNNFVYKKNLDSIIYNNYEELKNRRKVMLEKILNIIGEEHYKIIIGLYEKTYEEEDKAQEYYEYIEKYVKQNFDLTKKEKFEEFFYALISIDCHLNV